MLKAVQSGSNRGVLVYGSFVPSLIHQSGSNRARRNVEGRAQTRVLALKNPKGFGPPASKSSSSLPPSKPSAEQLEDMKKNRKQQQGFDDDDDDAIPEIVTDRMLKRIGVSVAIPLLLAVLFFPFFWYLKIVLKVDIPEWLPILVSGTFFGSAAFGITYGIVSTSWDPLRDGSLLGWKEAQVNWPIFFKNMQGKQDRK